MLEIAYDDDTLSALQRVTVPSDYAPRVSYLLDRFLDAGGMSIAFFALRRGPDGETPVVMKIMRPRIMRASSAAGELVVRKEAVALARLNERVPVTPFVVRLVDTGAFRVQQKEKELELPWLAVEYVHGGIEGTTLAERVNYCVERTGYAFDPYRAAHAIACLCSGLDAIHEERVIHRDLKPTNVLCCGFGEDEIFKISDFGVARPKGMQKTFGSTAIGTPGYAAPEQLALDDARTGPATDVFSLAATVFFLLTGEDYFPVRAPAEAIVLAQEKKRRSIALARTLSPELRERPVVCTSIDEALARATSTDPEHRPQSGAQFGNSLVHILRGEAKRLRASERRLRSVVGDNAPRLRSDWRWTVRHNPGDDRIVRSVAWDGDGSCLAALAKGLSFWDGTNWMEAPTAELPVPGGIRFVYRVGAGLWLIGGEQATLAHYSREGVSSIIRGADPEVTFTHASGDVGDLAVLVGVTPDHTAQLYTLCGRRWLKPLPLVEAASVSSLARLDDERWLVVGRSSEGGGLVAIFEPLRWELTNLNTPVVRAFIACSAQPDVGEGMVVGTDGRALRVEGSTPQVSTADGEPDLSAVAVDVNGRAWASSTGRLWLQQPEQVLQWTCMWADQSWSAPFISLFADVGLVFAMTVDGAVLEGRTSVIEARR